MDDVISKADVTVRDADYVRGLEQQLLDVTKHRDDLLVNAMAHENRMAGVLRESLALRSEHHDLMLRHAILTRDHANLKASLTRLGRVTPVDSAVHRDELGPITKDELDPQALRDGRLTRSAESRARRLAEQAKARAEGPSDDELEAVIAARRKAIEAKMDREEPPYNGKLKPMDVSNIVGGPNELALAAERQADRAALEQRAAEALNYTDPNSVMPSGDSCLADVAFPEVVASDETTNNPTGGTDAR